MISYKDNLMGEISAKKVSNVISIDFVNPKPLCLDDQVNLREIYEVLVAKGAVSNNVLYATWVKRKLQYYTDNMDYFTITKKDNRKNTRGATISKEHATTVQVAMEIIANGHKEAGHQMRRFLTNCLKLSISKPTSPSDFADFMIEMANKLKKSESANIALSEALGIATNWKSAVAWRKEFPELDILSDTDKGLGIELSKRCKAMGFTRRKIEDSRWGHVWIYSREFIETILPDLRMNLIC